jgi:hypothetical protein
MDSGAVFGPEFMWLTIAKILRKYKIKKRNKCPASLDGRRVGGTVWPGLLKLLEPAMST